jgi:predicted nucleotidyltransferase component of viral defense system
LEIDIYNWAVRFIRSQISEDNLRLVSLEDIAAFKLDAICHRKEKKDYIDLNLLPQKVFIR